LFCLIFFGRPNQMKSCCYFFFISYVSMCYLKVEHKIFHIRVKKKLDTRGRCSPHHKNVMFCDRVSASGTSRQAKEKKFCQNKQSQIILILLLLFFFKCWWTRVINTGFFFDFNVVEAGEKQQHIYIQTIILLQFKLTFFHSCFGTFFDLFFQHHFLVLTN